MSLTVVPDFVFYKFDLNDMRAFALGHSQKNIFQAFNKKMYSIIIAFLFLP